MKRRWIISGVLVLIALGVAGYFAYAHFFQSKPDEAATAKKTTLYSDLSQNMSKEKVTSDVDVASFVDRYGKFYDDAMKDIGKSNVSKWDQAMVDKAYLCLLYADKTGGSSQVQNIYDLIYAAGRSGVAVDHNAAGITQQERDAIVTRNGGQIRNSGDIKN